MTDIEQKALALVNEEPGYSCCHLGEVSSRLAVKALCRAIEQHEAFRQEVSDAVGAALRCEANFQMYAAVSMTDLKAHLSRFIIAKPDPLEQALLDAARDLSTDDFAKALRAAIKKRGGKIVWGEG